MNPQTEIDILKLEKAIAELEADWLRQLDGFKMHRQDKGLFPRIVDTSVLFGIIILAFFSILILFSMPFISLGIAVLTTVTIVVSVFYIYQNYKKAECYREEKAKYEEQREELLLEIQKIKAGA